ncbi:hypothetical protein PCE1_002941 [Barthelona sp. PCE]
MDFDKDEKNETPSDILKAIDDYKAETAKTAEHLIYHVFPRRFLELSKKVRELQSTPEALFDVDVLIDFRDFVPPEVLSRKRTASNLNGVLEDVDSESFKYNYCASNRVPMNRKLQGLLRDLKAELFSYIDSLGKVKHWIQMRVPKIEDGNNFGAAVQSEIIQELGNAEEAALETLEQITKYFLTRGKLISKSYKYPKLEDYINAIFELDEKQRMNVTMCFLDIRNNYLLIYDLLVKNIKLVKQPKGRTRQHQSLYG